MSENINEYSPQSGRMIGEDGGVDNILDPITRNPRNTNSDHSAIHYGLGFCMSLYAASIEAEGKQIFRFKGPTTLFAHLKGIEVSGQGATCAVRIIRSVEGSPIVFTDAGEEVVDAIQNLNDNSPITPQSKVYDTDVVYTGGKLWCQKVLHGSTDSQGNKNIQAGASFIQNPNSEYITKNGDTDYVLEIENLDDTNPLLHLMFSMFFYEENKGYVPFIF